MRRQRLLARAVPSPYADGADASFGDPCSARSVEPFDLVGLALGASLRRLRPALGLELDIRRALALLLGPKLLADELFLGLPLAFLANALTAQPLVTRQVAGRLLEAALHLVDQSHVR